MLQETMCEADKAISTLLCLCPGLLSCATNVVGLSSGLGVVWNPLAADLRAFSSNAAIVLKCRVRDLVDLVVIINCYGPYLDKRVLWEVENNSILVGTNVILGGDFNFTLHHGEVWGSHSRGDPLTDELGILFQRNPLMDITPFPLDPTWCNDRMGEALMAMRLDRFFILEYLAAICPKYHSWVIGSGIS